MKRIYTIAVMLVVLGAKAQISTLDFQLKYNHEMELYEAYIIILDGSASTVVDRVQFNAQFSIITPKDVTISVKEEFMPLQNNQTYMGTEPIDWRVANSAFSPPQNPDFNYFAIIPQLTPTGLYNDLEQGDEVLLFFVEASSEPSCFDEIRILNNETDPFDLGSLGDFSCGFSIGGVENLYNKNKDSFIPLWYIDGQLTTLDIGTNYKWIDCANQSIVTETSSPEYSPQQSSSYSVVVDESMCNYTSECIAVTISSVEDRIQNEISIYPNPSKGIFHIYTNPKIEHVKAWNNLGTEVNVNQVGLNSFEIADNVVGVYILNISYVNQTVSTHQVVILD